MRVFRPALVVRSVIISDRRPTRLNSHNTQAPARATQSRLLQPELDASPLADGPDRAARALARTLDPANAAFTEYFRSPAHLVEFEAPQKLSASAGYFRFGGAVCFGRCSGGASSTEVGSDLADLSGGVVHTSGRASLPFDLSEVATNLRRERYQQPAGSLLDLVTASAAARGIYYLFRPILSVAVRKHLQRLRLRGWTRIRFPNWPVDTTIETLMRSAMGTALKAGGLRRIPFVWFWPDGAPGACVVTHDVEDRAGETFCDALMDIDDSFGFKSAFQVVPEIRSRAPLQLLNQVRSRGFEGNVHDLNHDGRLFHSKKQFVERAAQINRYAKDFHCRGFRAGAMLRQQDWFDALDVSFDMSVPNVAHLEPQRGGCCTVMPYFLGHIVELPLTTIQDYSLFHILGDYSIALWKKQIDLILSNNGLIAILTHPDYLIEQRARAVYSQLLAHLRRLCDERRIWTAFPGEVDRWWRSRSQMTIVANGDTWRIEGPESQRARVAYATLENGSVVYRLD